MWEQGPYFCLKLHVIFKVILQKCHKDQKMSQGYFDESVILFKTEKKKEKPPGNYAWSPAYIFSGVSQGWLLVSCHEQTVKETKEIVRL